MSASRSSSKHSPNCSPGWLWNGSAGVGNEGTSALDHREGSAARRNEDSSDGRRRRCYFCAPQRSVLSTTRCLAQVLRRIMDYRRQKDACSSRRTLAPRGEAAMTRAIEKKTAATPPLVAPTRRMPDLDFLLKHSLMTLSELELSSLSRSSNALKHAKLEMEEAVAQREIAGVARWLLEHREDLLEAARRAILPAKGRELFEPGKLDEVLTRAKEEVRDCGRSQEEKEDGKMPSNWNVRQRTYFTDEQRRAGRSASEKQSRERRIAKGLCEKCTKPLAHHSIRECDAHLEIHRQRDARDRQKAGVEPGTQGRQPGTLKALKEANEKRKRGSKS